MANYLRTSYTAKRDSLIALYIGLLSRIEIPACTIETALYYSISADVAQLDRALAFEAMCRGFESLHPRHPSCGVIA